MSSIKNLNNNNNNNNNKNNNPTNTKHIELFLGQVLYFADGTKRRLGRVVRIIPPQQRFNTSCFIADFRNNIYAVDLDQLRDVYQIGGGYKRADALAKKRDQEERSDFYDYIHEDSCSVCESSHAPLVMCSGCIAVSHPECTEDGVPCNDAEWYCPKCIHTMEEQQEKRKEFEQKQLNHDEQEDQEENDDDEEEEEEEEEIIMMEFSDESTSSNNNQQQQQQRKKKKQQKQKISSSSSSSYQKRKRKKKSNPREPEFDPQIIRFRKVAEGFSRSNSENPVLQTLATHPIPEWDRWDVKNWLSHIDEGAYAHLSDVVLEREVNGEVLLDSNINYLRDVLGSFQIAARVTTVLSSVAVNQMRLGMIEKQSDMSSYL